MSHATVCWSTMYDVKIIFICSTSLPKYCPPTHLPHTQSNKFFLFAFLGLQFPLPSYSYLARKLLLSYFCNCSTGIFVPQKSRRAAGYFLDKSCGLTSLLYHGCTLTEGWRYTGNRTRWVYPSIFTLWLVSVKPERSYALCCVEHWKFYVPSW